MKKLAYLAFIILIFSLVGCNNSNTSGSFQSIINVNGTHYFLTTSDEIKYEIDKEIGTIQKTVSPDRFPDTHLSSNDLEEGSKLYTTVEDSNYILAERPNTNELLLYTLEENITSSD
ncbi:hypothetical protein [Halalkalibacter nanhaiisediminis]|uniref:Lipoprotein n=1 Tax=Halalkalibacter nanhaiisediminis TaxID=688079 RepID=A0A562QMP9_9BACI|nr:hypothetical protein [Halalkalibacter nanhaiisediminis]TWI58028.1 hypothetical protein IQ10_01359 [Halalkalibacter nanhaiisediminis]